MRKIANKTGCALGTIYLYFENKDVLIHSLIDEGFEKMYQLILNKVNQYQEPEKRLEIFCRQYVNFGISNPEYYEIMYLLHPERMNRYPKDKFRRARRTLELISNILEELAEKRGIIIKDSKLQSYSIWASLHGVITILLARRLDKKVDQNEFIETVIHKAVRSAI